MRKVRHREAEELVKGYTTRKECVLKVFELLILTTSERSFGGGELWGEFPDGARIKVHCRGCRFHPW